MVADLRKMQENQGVSENRIDKSGFIKENIDETIFMFAFFKCRKSDKGRN